MTSIPPQNEPQEQSNKDAFKHALCYVPFFSVLLFMIEKDKTPELKKHISYGMILLFGYLISTSILGILGLPFGTLFGIVYIAASGYLGFMAYNGKDITIEQFDEVEKQIKKNM
jgi:hypothetical protein